MTLEHFPEMAEAEIARHVEDALQRWPLLGVTVIHRYGRLTPGEQIVLVVTAASHRHEAFAAAEFLMDFLKTRAPFWKQVEYADGAQLGRRQGHRRRAGGPLGASRQPDARPNDLRRVTIRPCAGAGLRSCVRTRMLQHLRDAGEHRGEFVRVDAIGRHGDLHHRVGEDVGERELLLRSVHLISPCEVGCERGR